MLSHPVGQILTSDPQTALMTFVGGLAQGHNLIEERGAEGGIIVSPDIAQMAADMEVIIEAKYGGDTKAFHLDFLVEVNRASQNGDDPIEEVSLWLAALMKDL